MLTGKKTKAKGEVVLMHDGGSGGYNGRNCQTGIGHGSI